MRERGEEERRGIGFFYQQIINELSDIVCLRLSVRFINFFARFLHEGRRMGCFNGSREGLWYYLLVSRPFPQLTLDASHFMLRSF